MLKNDFSTIKCVSYIRNNIQSIPKLGGVYKHYIDEEGLSYFHGVYPTQKEKTETGDEVYLLYIGLSDNLFNRFKWHLGITNSAHSNIMNGTLSTLRLSYMANHKDIISLAEQNKLDNFMDEHIYIQYMVTNDFVSIEKELIEDNDLPLNIKGNIHPFTTINSERRTKIRHDYYQQYPESKKVINQRVVVSRKIDDFELIQYALEAEEEGINNKSKFLRWFRDVKKLSASQSRLYKAWEAK